MILILKNLIKKGVYIVVFSNVNIAKTLCSSLGFFFCQNVHGWL